jgi:hypothetical protein
MAIGLTVECKASLGTQAVKSFADCNSAVVRDTYDGRTLCIPLLD